MTGQDPVYLIRLSQLNELFESSMWDERDQQKFIGTLIPYTKDGVP